MEYLTEVSRTGPEPIPLDDVLEELRMHDRAQMALVTRNITRAVRYVEDRAQLTISPAVQRRLSFPGWIRGRDSLWSDWWGYWGAWYNAFDYTSARRNKAFLLTMPPWTSTDSVKYYDTDNTQQTVSASSYRTTDGGDGPAILEWDEDFELPSLKSREDAIQVTFTTGTSSPDPVAITAATLMLKYLIDENADMKNAADELIADMRNTCYGASPNG